MTYTVCCDDCLWQVSSEDPSIIGPWLAEHEHRYFSVYVEEG